MPLVTMPTQNGNSCAAHCTAIAIMELGGERISQTFTEDVLWDWIKFKGGEGPLSEHLAQQQNSDPRLIVKTVNAGWGGRVSATLRCDELEKSWAIKFHTPNDLRLGLQALYNMMKGANASVTIVPEVGVYYNCSFLMFNDPDPVPAAYTGMHNILITKTAAGIHYYNSNEANPAWVQNNAWKKLTGQNGGTHSYVFTGVFVEMR